MIWPAAIDGLVPGATDAREANRHADLRHAHRGHVRRGLHDARRPPRDHGRGRALGGDGHQVSKVMDAALLAAGGAGTPASRERRFWRIPVMDGEFVVEDRFGVRKGVAGGNFLILGRTPEVTLAAAERAAEAIRKVPGVILPFPGGIVRSGSKVGSKYKKLSASTNSPYCPTLRGSVKTALPDDVACVLEIVADGLTLEHVRRAMAAGIRAACGDGIARISAGNYGGKLGKHLVHLRPLLEGTTG